jgi:outer membrane protein OmpA-like peptidoglycan-associated protein
MAQRVGKCTNYSGCKLAYRKEEIKVVTKGFHCPECGSSLEPGGPKEGTSLISAISIGGAALLLLTTGVIVCALANSPKRRVVLGDPMSTPTLTPVTPPTPPPITESTPLLTPVPFVAPDPIVEASATPVAPDLCTSETDEVKRAVLKRIELMPNLSQAQKDKLYSAVERARGMNRLFTVSFETSVTKLSSHDTAFIQAQLNRPHLKQLLDDPTLILVILGFADKLGTQQANQDLSLERAKRVMELLRDTLGVQNVMHVVPMGSTDLLDPHNLVKNRVVEVWGASP